MFLLLAALSHAADALPDRLNLRYDLSVAGKTVGWREVDLRFLPHPAGERRIIQIYTELSVGPDAWKIRASGVSTPSSASFTCTVDHNGDLEQIQGVLQPGGAWQVSRTDGRDLEQKTIPRADARLSSLDLHDPGRSWRLDGAGPVGLLLVETGQILSGTLSEPSDATITLGDVLIPTRHYTASDATGTASFDLDVNNILVRSEISWIGIKLVSTLQDPPQLRVIQEMERMEIVPIKVQDL